MNYRSKMRLCLCSGGGLLIAAAGAVGLTMMALGASPSAELAVAASTAGSSAVAAAPRYAKRNAQPTLSTRKGFQGDFRSDVADGGVAGPACAGACPISTTNILNGSVCLTQTCEKNFTPGASVACGIMGAGTTANRYARCFDIFAELGGSPPLEIVSVKWGVEQLDHFAGSTGAVKININVYTDLACPPSDLTQVLVATASVSINEIDEGSIFVTPVFAPGGGLAVVSSGGTVVVEIEAPVDGTPTVPPDPPNPNEYAFRPMSNSDGACTDSFLLAADCGVPNYLPVSAIGFPGSQLVLSVTAMHEFLPIPVCGNTFLEACEECDDGNNLPGDGCDPICQLEPFCGDGVCDPGEDPCNCSVDCGPPALSEVGFCNDGLDNDCDGFIDCADSDCANDIACQPGACCLKDGTCVDGVAGPAACAALGGGVGNTFAGGGTLCINVICPPVNNLCDNRVEIFNDKTPFDNTSATLDGLVCEASMSGDIWYNYNSNFDGFLVIDTCQDAPPATLTDTILTVYDGCDCAGLGCAFDVPPGNELASNDDTAGCGIVVFGSEVTIPVVAGNCYKIQLGGFSGQTGTGNIAITKLQPGACCLWDGVCVDATLPTDCAALGGQFQGPGTACPPAGGVVCPPPPVGANLFLDPALFEAALPPDKRAKASWNFKPNKVAPGSGVALDDPLNINTHFLDPDSPWFNPPPPNNDACADRRPIFNGKTPFSNIVATLDGPTCDLNMDTDVWWNYLAGFTGLLTVDTCQDGPPATLTDTVLTVYDGCDCAALGCLLDVPPGNELASDDDSCGVAAFSSTVTVPVVQGNCYKIQVGGWNGATGTGIVTISKTIPINNDLCIDRRPIFNGKTPFNNLLATTDGPLCDSSMTGDVWWNSIADFSGPLTVDTCQDDPPATLTDTVLTVYNGCGCATLGCLLDVPPGNELASSDDDCGIAGFSSTVTVPVVQGNCYKIQVGGFLGAQGSSIITISKPPPPPQCEPAPGAPANDCCRERVLIGNGKTPFDKTGATQDGPVNPGTMTGDIWYNYIAAVDGFIDIDTCQVPAGGNDDTTLAVYKGCLPCPPVGALLASNDDAGCGPAGFNSAVKIPVIAGNCYKIQVGGFLGSFGTGVLAITKQGPPGTCDGDDCADGVVDVCFGGDPACFCFVSPTGGPQCGGDIACAAAVPCVAGVCPAGFVCVTDTCCGVGLEICVPVRCSVPLAPLPPGTPTAAGGLARSRSDMGAVGQDGGISGGGGGGGINLWPPSVDNVTFQSNAGPNPQPPLPNPTGIDGLFFGNSLFGYDNNVLVANFFTDSFDILSGPPAGDNHTAMSIEIVAASAGGPLGPILVTVYDKQEIPRAKLKVDIFQNPPPPPPRNDLCQDVPPVQLVRDLSVKFAGDNTNSTADCALLGAPGYTWEAIIMPADPLATVLNIEYCGTANSNIGGPFNNAFIVLTQGCPCASLVFAANFAASCADGNLQLQWTGLTPSKTYYYPVLLDPVNDAIGPYTLTFTAKNEVPPPPCDQALPGAPVNNCCKARIQITNGKTPFDNTGATQDGPANPGSMTGDIWYNYVADVDGMVDIDTCQVGPVPPDMDDTTLAVYKGCDPLACPVGAPIASNDDTAGCGPLGFNSAVKIPVIAGNCYKIQVGGFMGTEGSGTLTITKQAPPPQNNNLCVGRRPVFNGQTAYDNTGATQDGPPNPATMTGDLWWNYIAEFTGMVDIDTCRLPGLPTDNEDTTLAVYKGCVCPVGAPIASNDDAGCGGPDGFNSAVKIPVVAGNCYKIQVGGFLGSEGTNTLTITKQLPAEAAAGGRPALGAFGQGGKSDVQKAGQKAAQIAMQKRGVGHPTVQPLGSGRMLIDKAGTITGGVAGGPLKKTFLGIIMKEPLTIGRVNLLDLGGGSEGISKVTVYADFPGISQTDIAGPLGPGVPDGCVDAFDLALLLNEWCSSFGDPDPIGDVDPPCEGCASLFFTLADISGPDSAPDGCVDAFDLAKLLFSWCSSITNPCGTCF